MDEKLKSLNVEDIGQACDLIRKFRIAMSNLLLYPPGSDLVTESIGEANALLSTILEKYKTLIVSEAEGGLVVNAVRLDIEERDVVAGIFMDAINACNIKSIAFRKGITIKELHLLLDSLVRKRTLKGTGDSILQLFKVENVTHIGLNEKIYAAIGDSDLVIERGAEIVEKSGGSIDVIMKALNEVSEMVSSIEDDSARDKVKLEIAEKIIASDPRLLVELVRSKPNLERQMGTVSITTVGKDEIGFSTGEIKAIVSDITTGYREILHGDEKGFASLKEAINKILSLTKDRVHSLGLYNELLKQTDILETLTPSIGCTEITSDTLSERIENLIEKDALSLITDESIKSVQDLFEKVVSEDELQLANKLCGKLSRNFDSPVSDIRFKTATSIKKLYNTIETLRARNIVQSLDNKLMEVEDKEHHSGTYSEIASILAQAATRYLKEENYTKPLEIIRLFKKHANIKADELLWKQKLATHTMSKMAESELARLLLDEFCLSKAEKKDKAATLLVELGDFATSPLIKRIKETDDIEARKAITFLLERIGETAITRLVEELDVEKRTEVLLKIMELLDKISYEGLIVEQLREVLSNPDFQVRRAAIYKLNQIGTERAREIMLDVVINDPSPTLRQISIAFLGETRYAPAVDTLIEIISSRRIISVKGWETLQEEACIALGKIGETRAITPIREIARSHKPFQRPKPENIRIAAVEALAKLGDKELDNFVNDKNPLIQKIVRESLEKK